MRKQKQCEIIGMGKKWILNNHNFMETADGYHQCQKCGLLLNEEQHDQILKKSTNLTINYK